MDFNVSDDKTAVSEAGCMYKIDNGKIKFLFRQEFSEPTGNPIKAPAAKISANLTNNEDSTITCEDKIEGKEVLEPNENQKFPAFSANCITDPNNRSQNPQSGQAMMVQFEDDLVSEEGEEYFIKWFDLDFQMKNN